MARGRSCKLKRKPKPGVNPATCLSTLRLIGDLDFLWPNGLALSSCFLFAKIEVRAFGVTLATTETGSTLLVVCLSSLAAGATTDGGKIPLTGPTCFTRGLQDKLPIIPAK